MSRVIKFRVWRDGFIWPTEKKEVQPGAWLEPQYIGPDGKAYHYDCEIISSHYTEQYGGKIHIEQFTGHKDSKGVELYEGDIFVCDLNPVIARYETVYQESSFCAKTIASTLYSVGTVKPLHQDFLLLSHTIIGNIHEHPHLLT